LDFDGKVRYLENQRIEVYTKMHEWIKRRSKNLIVYLCMESSSVWKAAKIPIQKHPSW